MPVERIAPTLTGPVLTGQYWDNLAFLHWPVDPDAIAGLFPPGVAPDVIDGVSYVGLVPFEMRGAGPGRLSVGYFGRFCETNVRLYSVDAQDRHGIVFLTLDASRLATVLVARVSLGLPYAWSAMHVRQDADVISYSSRRRWPERRRRAQAVVRLRVGAAVEPAPVEVWLTSRWGLHTRVGGQTLWLPNQHGPWPLRSAELLALNGDLVAACGVDVRRDEMLRPLFSPGVQTTFGSPSRVRG